jgi:hypothetical protein
MPGTIQASFAEAGAEVKVMPKLSAAREASRAFFHETVIVLSTRAPMDIKRVGARTDLTGNIS